MSDLLFSSFTLGRLTLPNRVVMAPMTRSRAIGNVPSDLVATYYAQRAEAGLIVTEGVAPSPDGLGYARIPGVWSDAQVAGWRRVTDAVHAAGGRIFAQLMHTGRIAHPLNQPPGARVVAPSAVAAPGTMWTDTAGQQPHPVPEALADAEVEATIEAFVTAAGRAVLEAGFDGVELHGANGYLIEQFLNAATNLRDDRWGGTIEGRARFAVEVARRVAARIGADRTAIRLSPYGAAGGMTSDEHTPALYAHLATELGELGLAYVHVVDHAALGAPPVPDAVKASIRAAFGGPIVLSGGYDAARAEADLQAGRGELVAFGRPFIANPRLVSKLRTGGALRAPDLATFYTPGAEGYTDYPLA
jgi:N-ethylmaleimide reductase